MYVCVRSKKHHDIGVKKTFLKYRIFRCFRRNGDFSKIFEFREKWGQKNIFLNIDLFEFSNEIEKLLKFLTLENRVKKTFFVNTAYSECSGEMGNNSNIFCETLVR